MTNGARAEPAPGKRNDEFKSPGETGCAHTSARTRANWRPICASLREAPLNIAARAQLINRNLHFFGAAARGHFRPHWGAILGQSGADRWAPDRAAAAAAAAAIYIGRAQVRLAHTMSASMMGASWRESAESRDDDSKQLSLLLLSAATLESKQMSSKATTFVWTPNKGLRRTESTARG